jgi:hypothetical protein
VDSRLAKGWVRACGVLVLLTGALVLFNAPSPGECHPDPTPPHASLRLAAFVAAAAAVGVGLLYLQRWAAAAFAVASSSLGVSLMASPLRGVPVPWALINLAVGAALIFSAVVVMRHWPLLSWGRGRLR